MKKLKLYYVTSYKYDSCWPIVLVYNKRQACSLYYNELNRDVDFKEFEAYLMTPNEDWLYEIKEDEWEWKDDFKTIKEVEDEIKRIWEPCFWLF